MNMIAICGEEIQVLKNKKMESKDGSLPYAPNPTS